jgi:invasion protein IalB
MVRKRRPRVLAAGPIALAVGLIAFAIGLEGAAAQQAVPANGPVPANRPGPAQRVVKPPQAAPIQHIAQTPPSPATEAPQRTTATYEDWILRCDIQQGPPPQKVCDMAQLAQVQGQANPISRVAIGRPAKGEPVKLLIQLPVNVSFTTGVKIQSDDKDPGLLAPFRRCVPAGCFADVELREETIKKFRTLTEAGKLTFKDAAEHDTVIPLSFKGFGQSYDALLKQ